jgi:hypothetical protein
MNPQASLHAKALVDYMSGDSATFARSTAEWKKMKKHIQKELPKAVKNHIERDFDNVESKLLNVLPDIIRNELSRITKGYPLCGSSPASPGPASRSPSPKVLDHRLPSDDSKTLNMDSVFIEAPLFSHFMPTSDFVHNQQFDPLADCGLDSGYASNGSITMTHPHDWL